MTSNEERNKIIDGLGTRVTLKDYREMRIDWDIEDINEFLTTKGTRLNTTNMRLKKESDVRFILMHRIEDTLRIRPTGIEYGTLDYGMYHREKKRQEKRKQRRRNE